jgi:hypothetical protein
MSQRSSGYARQPLDEYETPPWVTLAVEPYLMKQCVHLWDPANGPQSKIARALRDRGFEVIATNDDFLTRDSPPSDRTQAIVTNPPYGSQGKLACQFINHALELVPIVAMLLRVDFDSARTRTSLFRDCEAFARKIVLLNSITWFEREGAAGPSDNHAWFIWNKRHHGPPAISYARRSQ